MRTTFCFITSLILSLSASISFGQTADEIIQKYITASGGIEKMKAIKTEKTVVAIEQGGITFNQTIFKKRPLMFREETLIQGKTSLQVFNGNEGWTLNPFTGRETVEAMTEDDVKEMKIQADMDGELIDYSKKGFKVNFEGEEDVDGSMAYKLKLVTDKNDVINFFIDKESSYLVKQTFKQKNEDGSEMESIFTFSNFKAVDGVIRPFELEASSTYMGQVYKTPIKIISIEANKEMSDDLFKKPEVKN
jgi:hypothetical protein